LAGLLAVADEAQHGVEERHDGAGVEFVLGVGGALVRMV